MRIAIGRENDKKLLVPVWDFAWYFTLKEFTQQQLRDEISEIKNMGFKRLHVVVDLPGYPMFSTPQTAPAEGNIKTKNIKNLGDLNAAVAKACRELGIEAIAIFKPYENGGMLTVPDGVEIKEKGFREKTVGGTAMFFDEFVGSNPQMRVARRDDFDPDDFNSTITKIEMDFMLDSYTVFTRHGEARNSMEIPDSESKSPKPTIWISKDNGKYELYKKNFSYRYELNLRNIRGANGFPIDSGKRCKTLVIENLDIDSKYPYAAVSFEDSDMLRKIYELIIR